MKVYLEKGYGKQLNYIFEDYQQGSPQIFSCSRQKAFKQDIVLILRSPILKEYDLLGKNSVFMTMIHFPTRPKRITTLKKNNVKTISLDSIADYKKFV